MNLKTAIQTYIQRAQDAAKTAGEVPPTVPYLLEYVDLAQMPRGTTRRHVLRKAMNMGLLAPDACSKWEKSISPEGTVIPQGRRGGAELHIDAVLQETPAAQRAAELLAAQAAVDAPEVAPEDASTAIDATALQLGENEPTSTPAMAPTAPDARCRSAAG